MSKRAVPRPRRVILNIAAGLVCAIFGAGLVACKRKSTAAFENSSPASIVLYVSADDALFRPVIKSFEEKTGAKVRIVGDTEATKTFGLVRRLLDEKEEPRADVFWASEPLGMIRLADAGVLQNLAGTITPGASAQWIPLAYRARVIVYLPGRFAPGTEPRRLGDLLNPSLKGKVGLARPQFGTTRTHMATLLAEFGEEKYLAFVRALKANDARLYDGNSTVTQAVAQGEISAGLTDSDDVAAGLEQRWPIASSEGTIELAASSPGQSGGAALLMPHVAGVVTGAKNVELANAFIAHLLSDEVQRLFLTTGSAILPGEAAVFQTNPPVPQKIEVGPLSRPNYQTVAPLEAKAIELFERAWSTK